MEKNQIDLFHSFKQVYLTHCVHLARVHKLHRCEVSVESALYALNDSDVNSLSIFPNGVCVLNDDFSAFFCDERLLQVSEKFMNMKLFVNRNRGVHLMEINTTANSLLDIHVRGPVLICK